jgi:hypothetical protein
MNRLEEGSFALFFDGKRLEPASIEKNIVGFCSKCDGELESLAYHKTGEGWLVSARCNSLHQVLIQYDEMLNWRSSRSLKAYLLCPGSSLKPSLQLPRSGPWRSVREECRTPGRICTGPGPSTRSSRSFLE